jgi:hypothetical protein
VIDDLKIKTINYLSEIFEMHDICWALIGSTNLAIQKVNITPFDIDIITDYGGLYKIAELLRDYVKTPANYIISEKIKSHYMKLCVFGVWIDIFSNIRNNVNGLFENTHSNWKKNIHLIRLIDHEIPVMSLNFEFNIYKKIRDDLKATKIAEIIF